MVEKDTNVDYLKHERDDLIIQKNNIERQIQTERQKLKSQLSRLGVAVSTPTESTILSHSSMISRGHHHLLPLYQRAQSTKTNIETHKQRKRQITDQLIHVRHKIENETKS